MASFKIYSDQENVCAQVKNKELSKPIQKRPVLGLLSANTKGEEFATGANSKKSENVPSQESTLKPSEPMLKDDLLSVAINNGTKINKDNRKEPAKREPLKDVTVATSENVSEPMSEEILESPMVIDKSPAISDSSKVVSTKFYECSVYGDDVYKYLRTLETKHRPKAYYMRRQPDVTYSMRSILVDWLVEVSEEYKLHSETLFLAVSYIDRFLSCMAVVRAKLQLLGTSAMFIAAKFEEIYPPEVGEFTYITDDTYTRKQVLRMEHLILKVLSFDLSAPTAYTFVLHVCVCAQLSEKVLYLSMYISELSLLEADPYLEYNPSLIACGAIALARHCLGHVDVWTASLANITGYSLQNLAPIIPHLNKTHMSSFNASPTGAIKEKYNSYKLQHVSQIPYRKLIIRDTGLGALG